MNAALPFALPLLAAMVYVVGALLAKRSAESGVGVWRTAFISNVISALLFALLLPFGGTIHVDSTEGRGSTFHVYIPLVLDATIEAAPSLVASRADGRAPTPTLSSGIEHSLLVEDDGAVATATTRMLQRAGYDVARAEHGLA